MIKIDARLYFVNPTQIILVQSTAIKNDAEIQKVDREVAHVYNETSFLIGLRTRTGRAINNSLP